MHLYAVKYGESQLNAKFIFRDTTSEELVRISWSYYIALHQGKTILFDVGFRNSVTAQTWGIELQDVHEATKQLLPQNNVDLIFITHHHFDHIENIDLFPTAQIVISAPDYLHAMESCSICVQERLRQHHVTIVEDEYIYADTFRFKVIGGHTAGSAVIYFENQQRKYVLTGDECYQCVNLLNQRPIGIYENAVNNESFLHDAFQEGYIPLPCHDLAIFDTYPRFNEHIVQIL